MSASLGDIHYAEIVVDDDGTVHAIAECLNCGASHSSEYPEELDVWIVAHHGEDCTAILEIRAAS